MISYSRQGINDDDVKAICEVMKDDFLTTGPKIEEFEDALCNYSGSKFCRVLSSGTAALHAAMFAIDLKPGDEVIIPTMTFVATANCVRYMHGTVVLCDVDDSLCIDPEKIENLITPKTKAVICVDYAGQACNYPRIKDICGLHNLYLISDACHSMQVDPRADITCFSFHPVKHITTGEGGACLTDHYIFNLMIQSFRNHGRVDNDTVSLGYNYRMNDIQAALGISQLKRIKQKLNERSKIAKKYDEHFETIEHKRQHTYHLYVIKVDNRDVVMGYLKYKGIGCQIHYKPIYDLHYYEGLRGNFENTEKLKDKILSIPLYPGLSENEQEYIIREIKQCLNLK